MKDVCRNWKRKDVPNESTWIFLPVDCLHVVAIYECNITK